MINRARIQDWVEARMNATGVITRPRSVDRDRDATVDTGTLVVTPATPTVTYTGIASVVGINTHGGQNVDNGRADASATMVVGFPLGTDALPGDRFTISTIVGDAQSAGRVVTLGRERRSSRRVRMVFDATEARTA